MRSLFALMSLVIGLATACATRAEEPMVIEGIVAAPVAEVWKAWTTKAGLESWLAPHADIDLRVGGLMRSTYDPKGRLGDAGTIENRLLAVERERLLTIQVAKAPDDFPFRPIVSSMKTTLTFEPTADNRTLVRISATGFTDEVESQRMKNFFSRGNARTMTQLQERFQK